MALPQGHSGRPPPRAGLTTSPQSLFPASQSHFFSADAPSSRPMLATKHKSCARAWLPSTYTCCPMPDTKSCGVRLGGKLCATFSFFRHPRLHLFSAHPPPPPLLPCRREKPHEPLCRSHCAQQAPGPVFARVERSKFVSQKRFKATTSWHALLCYTLTKVRGTTKRTAGVSFKQTMRMSAVNVPAVAGWAPRAGWRGLGAEGLHPTAAVNPASPQSIVVTLCCRCATAGRAA